MYQQSQKLKKLKNNLVIFTVILVLAICVGLGYFFFDKHQNKKNFINGHIVYKDIDIDYAFDADEKLQKLQDDNFLVLSYADAEAVTTPDEGVKIPFTINFRGKSEIIVNSPDSESIVLHFECNEDVTIKKNGKAINTIKEDSTNSGTYTCTRDTIYELSNTCENGGTVDFENYVAHDEQSCEQLVADEEEDCTSDLVIKVNERYSCVGCTTDKKVEENYYEINYDSDTDKYSCDDGNIVSTQVCQNNTLGATYHQIDGIGNIITDISGYVQGKCYSALNYENEEAYSNANDDEIQVKHKIRKMLDDLLNFDLFDDAKTQTWAESNATASKADVHSKFVQPIIGEILTTLNDFNLSGTSIQDASDLIGKYDFATENYTFIEWSSDDLTDDVYKKDAANVLKFISPDVHIEFSKVYGKITNPTL
tara:strand:+ start:3819 stop:5087 length:1269 start_codon:yes stop_codon:yes gene_type:complete